MRRTLQVLLCLMAAGCGGGGGGAGAATGPSEAELTAIAVLERCGHPALTGFLEVLDGFAWILDPGAAAPPRLRFTAVEGDTVRWRLDLDGDGTDDLAGTVRFLDALGDPFQPFDLTQLPGSPNRLVDYLDQVPDGSTLQIAFAAAGTGNRSGQLLADVSGGRADPVQGSGNVVLADCSGTFAFDPTPLSRLLGAVPRTTLDTVITSGVNVLLGTIELDGTPAARFTVRLNVGREDLRLLLDLNTGRAQAVP